MAKMTLVKPKVKNIHWGLALLVGLIFDIVDWLGVGLIPGVGDVFDLIAVGVLFKLVGPIALFGAVELLPVAVTDALPVFTVTVIVAWLYNGSSRMLR